MSDSEPPRDPPPEQVPDPADERSLDTPGRRGTLIGGLWNMASELIPMLGTAALSIVMGRVLGASALGTQSLIAYAESLITSLLVWAFTAASIQALASRRGAGDRSGFARLGRWSFWAHAVAGSVSALVLAGIGVFSDTPLPWFIVSTSAVINALGWAYASRIVGAKGWTPVASRRLVTQSVSQVLGIAAVLIGLGINGVFAANVVAALGLLVALARIAPPLGRPSFAPFPREVLQLVGVFFLLSLLSQVVNKRIEFLFLGAFSTTQQVAMYSVAFMLVSSASTIPSALIGAGMPSVAKWHGADEMHRVAWQLGTAFRVTLAASLPLTAAIVTLGPGLVRLLYGEAFDEAAMLIPLLSLSTIVVPSGVLAAAFWTGIGSLRPLVLAEAIGGVLDVGLAWWAVPRFDAWGAAIANVAGQSLASLLLVISIRLRMGRFRIALPRLFFTTVVSVVAGIFGLVVQLEIGGWAGLLAGAAVLLVVLGVAGRLIGFLGADDAEWLRGTLPTRLGWSVSLVARGG